MFFLCVFLPSAYREGSVVHFYVYFYFVKLMKFVNLIFVLYWPSLNLSVMFHDDDFHEADVNYRFLFFPHFISTMYKVLPNVIIFRNAITINYIQYKFWKIPRFKAIIFSIGAPVRLLSLRQTEVEFLVTNLTWPQRTREKWSRSKLSLETKLSA
jgi:hypothetical protein